MWLAICRPTIILENTSIRNAKYIRPSHVRRYVKSPAPQAVRSVSREVPLYEIGALLSVWIGDGGPPWLPAPLGASNALLARQPGDSVTADLLAPSPQLVPHPRIAVALEVLLVHLPDPGDQPLILDAASRALAGAALVVRGR